MYKLLIVDDEHHIVDWLYGLFISEFKLELDIYKAYSVEEAIICFEHNKIDVVISDMKMPGMSGLDLLELIYSKWLPCKVIFLTGYSQFDYIYRANKYKDVIYILKTEDDDVIIKGVQQQLATIKSDVYTKRKSEEHYKRNKAFVQSTFLFELFSGGQPYEGVSQSTFDELKIPIHINEPCLLLMGKIHKKQESDDYRYSESIGHLIKEYVNPLVRFIQCDLHKGEYAWLMQPIKEVTLEDTKQFNQYFEDVKQLLEKVQIICRAQFKISITFVIADSRIYFTELQEKVNELKHIIRYKLNNNKRLIQSEVITVQSNKEADSVFLENMDESLNSVLLETYLLQGQRRQFLERMSHIIKSFQEVESMHYTPVVEIYYALSLVLLKFINKYDLNQELSFKIGIYKLTRINAFDSWREAGAYLMKLSKLLFDVQDCREDDNGLKLIGGIRNYVHENLQGDLSLERIAEYVNYNPSYVSRTYKKLTGLNISEFVNNTKINTAKRMLEEDHITINEIAKSVGFNSSQYFSTVFKKYVFISPKEYRESYLEGKYSEQKSRN